MFVKFFSLWNVSWTLGMVKFEKNQYNPPIASLKILRCQSRFPCSSLQDKLFVFLLLAKFGPDASQFFLENTPSKGHVFLGYPFKQGFPIILTLIWWLTARSWCDFFCIRYDLVCEALPGCQSPLALKLLGRSFASGYRKIYDILYAQ